MQWQNRSATEEQPRTLSLAGADPHVTLPAISVMQVSFTQLTADFLWNWFCSTTFALAWPALKGHWPDVAAMH